MPWCKLHTDIVGDAKLLRATRRGGKHLVVLPWLMAWAAAHDPENQGRLVLDGEPAEPEDIAPLLPGVTAAMVRACEDAAEAIGVLVRDADGALRFAAWDHRSGDGSRKPSDHPDAVRERVQRHRERKALAHNDNAEAGAAGDTRGNAGGNAPCNALQPDVQRDRNALDGEGDREGEGEKPSTYLPTGGGPGVALAVIDGGARGNVTTRRESLRAQLGDTLSAEERERALIAVTDAVPPTADGRDVVLEVMLTAARAGQDPGRFLWVTYHALHPVGGRAATGAQVALALGRWLTKRRTDDLRHFAAFMERAPFERAAEASAPGTSTAVAPPARNRAEALGDEAERMAVESARRVQAAIQSVANARRMP